MTKLRNITKWYHASPIDNLESILSTGQILPGAHGFIYLSNTPEDAGRFCLYHGHPRWALFKTHRRDISVDRLQPNPAFRQLPIGFSEDFVTAIYDQAITVGSHKVCSEADIPNILPPGVQMVRDLKDTGTFRLGMTVTDADAMLKHYFKQNPGEMRRAFRERGMALPDFLDGASEN